MRISRGTLLDVAVGSWILIWCWMGIAVAQDLRGLRHLSDTVTSVGAAAQDTGATLSSLARISPVAGAELQRTAASVQEAGRRAVESGRQSRGSIRRTSILLAISIALIPSASVLFVYLPARRARRAGRGPDGVMA